MPIFCDLYLLDAVLKQVVVQEVHVDDLLHWRLVVEEVGEGAGSSERAEPAFGSGGAPVRVKEELLGFVGEGILALVTVVALVAFMAVLLWL